MSFFYQILLMSSVLFVILCFFLEVIIRYFRLADYVIYRPSSSIGYHPVCDSSGLMRKRYRWRFNRMGLRSNSDEAIDPDGVVLIGDSIIEGGAMVDQDDTVSYFLSKYIGKPVYPVCGAGWSLANELAFLEENPDLLNARRFIFVVNSGDFCPMNTWKTKYTHPVAEPVWHLGYLLGRMIWICQFTITEYFARKRKKYTVIADDCQEWPNALSRFFERYEGSVLWVLYPSQSEVLQRRKAWNTIKCLISDTAIVYEVDDSCFWKADCYQDGLHPNAKGRRVLAELIASALQSFQAPQHKSIGD